MYTNSTPGVVKILLKVFITEIKDIHLIKTPPTNIDLFIVYSIETLYEKTLVKFVDNSKNHKQIILISDNVEKKFKIIKKLKPTVITLQDDMQTTYYNKIRNSINNYK